MKPNKLIRSLRWAAVGLALLLGPPARAQWVANFTGTVTEATDPDGYFQGLVSVGTAVSGHYTYDPTQPFNIQGEIRLTLGTVPVTNYYPLQLTVADGWWPGDHFQLQTYTVHPPEFSQVGAPYLDGEIFLDLDDPTGTALTGSDLLDLPLGNAWLGSFATAGGKFTVWLYDPATALFTPVAAAQFNITSYETSLPTPILFPSPAYAIVNETDGSITVTVKRVGDTSAQATVDYATVDDTAKADSDYTTTKGTLTFAPGVTSQSFTVPILDDTDREGYEAFQVEFTNVTGASANVAPLYVNIADDEPAPPYVGGFSLKLVEANTDTLTVPVFRFGDLSEATTLNYQTQDGSAVLNEDHVATSGSLTFAPGEDTKLITLTILQDNVKEAIEEFSILLNNVVGAVPESQSLSVKIFDPVPLMVDPTFNPGAGADGDVYDMIPLPDGKIYALGSFTNIGGFNRPFIARLNANGSVDKAFGAVRLERSGNDNGQSRGSQYGGDHSVSRAKLGLDNAVSALIPLADGRVLIGGHFTSVGGKEQPFLARLWADGRLDNTFRPEINGGVFRMALQPDGKLVIVGDFTEVNGVPRQNIARLTANGRLDTTFDAGVGPDWPPIAVALQPDGRILVGGAFSTWSGASRRAAARLLPNGQLDSTYDLKIDDYGPYFFPYVTKFIVRPDGSYFLVGSSLYQVAGTFVNGVPVLVNNDDTVNKSYSGYVNWVFANRPPTAAELMPDGSLVLSGMFQYVPFNDPDPVLPPDDSFSLWRFKPDGFPDFNMDPANFPVTDFFTETGPSFIGMILDAAVQTDGKILIAGNFTRVAGVPRKGMARIIAP